MTGWLTTQLQFAEHRWDYGYHAFQQMDFFTQWERIYPSIKLGDIIQDDSYGILTPGDVYSPEHPITFLRATDMRSHMEVDSSEALKVPEEYYRHTRARLRENDIMLAIKGASIASGKSVCFVGFEPKDTLVNGTVFHFQVKDPHNPFFVATMLDSEIVKGQVRSLQIPNNAVAYVDKPSIHALRIPLPPRDVQDHIVGMMQAAYAARREKLAKADILLDGIEQHILDLLEIRPESSESQSTFLVKRSELHRADVRFFLPHYSRLEQAVAAGKYSTQQLSHLCEKLTNGLTPSREGYTDDGRVVVKVASMSRGWRVDWDKVSFTSEESFQKAKKARLMDKDILILSASHQLHWQKLCIGQRHTC